MKKLLSSVTTLLLCSFVIGQAKDGTQEYKSISRAQPVALIYLPYSPNVAEHAFRSYLLKTKGKDEKTGYQLSVNTALIKANTENANINFAIGAKENGSANECVVYLKLNSLSENNDNSSPTDIQFDMEDAKEYLDNMAVAIKSEATALQLIQQKKSLAIAQQHGRDLADKAIDLEKTRKAIAKEQTAANRNEKQQKDLDKRMAANQHDIDVNLASQGNQNTIINNQQASLALLTDRSKN